VTAQATSTGANALADDLPLLADVFGLGGISDVRFLAEGLMNRNWQIIAGRGVFALKQIIDVPLPAARRNLAVVRALASDGVPACSPVVTAGGDMVAEAGGRGYCLFPWVDGCQPHGTELVPGQARSLGAVLGRIHESLNRLAPGAGMPGRPASLRSRVPEPAVALAEADRFLAHIARLRSRQRWDLAVADCLERRKILLGRHESSRPDGDVPAGPSGWTHGDFQHLNVIWQDGEVAGVIDWDRVSVRPFGEEVARSATLLFGCDSGVLDLGRVAAFVSGYRAVVPVSGEDLADAVDRLWWKRMCDYWHLVFHYDRGNSSCDHLFLPASRFLDWWTSRREDVQAAFAARP